MYAHFIVRWKKMFPNALQLLSEEQFRCIEKIKTTGYTYMAASGLTMTQEDIANNVHVVAMAEYALRMQEQLHHVNEHSFNHFKIRIGSWTSSLHVLC